MQKGRGTVMWDESNWNHWFAELEVVQSKRIKVINNQQSQLRRLAHLVLSEITATKTSTNSPACPELGALTQYVMC